MHAVFLCGCCDHPPTARGENRVARHAGVQMCSPPHSQQRPPGPGCVCGRAQQFVDIRGRDHRTYVTETPSGVCWTCFACGRSRGRSWRPRRPQRFVLSHAARRLLWPLLRKREMCAIEATDGELHSCIDVCRETSLAAAAAIDAKFAAGEPLGKLAGLPIVVKANLDVAGTLSTAATPALKDWRPSSNADCVQPLVDAGAIVIAKTNMPELAMRGGGWSSLHGICYNPRNRARCWRQQLGNSVGNCRRVCLGGPRLGHRGFDAVASCLLWDRRYAALPRPLAGRWLHST